MGGAGSDRTCSPPTRRLLLSVSLYEADGHMWPSAKALREASVGRAGLAIFCDALHECDEEMAGYEGV